MNLKLPEELHTMVTKARHCEGCGVRLQFFQETSPGFIDYHIYKNFIENEMLFMSKKKNEIEELIFDRTLVNSYFKLPSKKELKV